MKRLSWLMIVAWFVSACLAPDIKGYFAIPVRAEDVILLAMLALTLLQIIISSDRCYIPRLLVIISSFILFLGCLSLAVLFFYMLFNVALPDTGTGGHSAFAEVSKEYLRLIKYILIVFVFSFLKFDAWHTLVKTLLICCVVIIIIQFLQYLRVPGVNETIVLVYGGEYGMAFVGYGADWAAEYGAFRAGSIFGSANVAGSFLILPFILILMLTIKRFVTGFYSYGQKAISVFMLFFIFMGIFLSQCRTAIIAITMGVLTSLVCIRKYIRLKQSAVFIMMFSMIATVLMLAFIFSDHMNKFGSKFRDGFGHESLGRKHELILEETADFSYTQLFFGKGPGLAPRVDSEIGHLLTWYGFLGLIGYFIFYLGVFQAARSGIEDDYIRSAFLGIIVAFVIGAVPASFFLNIRVFPIFLAMLSVAMRQRDASQIVEVA